MLLFATEFPVSAHRTTADFLRGMVTWLSGALHTKLSPEELQALQQNSDADIEHGNERVQSRVACSSDIDLAGIRYGLRDKGLEWQTSVVFSKTSTGAWIGVRVECASQRPAAGLPKARKPAVISSLLKALGGAADGSWPVLERAHVLASADIDRAAQLMRGRARCRLPLVYVSAPFQGEHAVDIDRLAADLSGMAHVVVEPSRQFSARLQREVDAGNVYGGAIGIYWPEGGGQRVFSRKNAPSPGHLTNAIKDAIQAAWLNRCPITTCTWAYVCEAASQHTIRLLQASVQASVSKEIEDYAEAFDQEIKDQNQRLEDAEREIQRLRHELSTYEARAELARSGLLQFGRERDLYPNEVLGIVHKALKDAFSQSLRDSRRQHVLAAILEANPLDDNPLESRREQLKDVFRHMTTIDKPMRHKLESLGFIISEDGKHFKLVFQGDSRYTFSVSKSCSDRRGGLNAASEIANLLF